MSRKWEKEQTSYPGKQVVRFRSLDKHEEDAFTLELSNTMKCHEVERRVADQLGLNYQTEIGMTRIPLTSHSYHSDQPKYEPERWQNTILWDMLGHKCRRFDILYYQVLDTPVEQADPTMNIPFYHAARDELSIYNVESRSLTTVRDMLYKLKSKVQLSRPNAELRLLLLRSNSIRKIYPLNERFYNLPATWPLRAEEVLEGEKYIGSRDMMIQVNHVNSEVLTGKMSKYPYNGRNFGHPFLLVIHEEETLADIKLRLHKKYQVPDNDLFKWKSARGKYFQDSDILFHHFEQVNDWSNRGSSYIPILCLEHSYNSWKTTSAANQQQESELLVAHSGYLPGPRLIEVGQAETVNPVDSPPLKDSSCTRFLWTIKSFSKLRAEEHYSDVFFVSCYEWRAMIFPKGNNVDHLSVYLNTADSTTSVYAEFSLAVVNQSHAEYTVRIDTQHEFSPRRSSWGAASLIPLSELNDPGKGYIINDTCIIEANVSVVRPIKKQKLGVPFMEKSSDNFIKNNALPRNSKEIHSEVVPMFVKVEAPDEEMINDVATTEPSKLIGITSSLLEYPTAGQLYEEPQNFLDEKFEEIGGFSVLKTQSSLYKDIWLKYGHIASSLVPTSSLYSSLYSADVALVADIMAFVMDMNSTRFSEISPSRIETWERKLKMAEKLEFNIKWLRQRFEVIKKVFYEEYQSMQAEKARFVQVENELRKARETISAMEIEREKYLEKNNRFLFDGSI